MQREKAAALRRLHGGTASPTRSPAPSTSHSFPAGQAEQTRSSAGAPAGSRIGSGNLDAPACQGPPYPDAAAGGAAAKLQERRHAALRQRMAFEERNRGGFQRVYPVPESQAGAAALMEEYAQCAAVAAANCEQHHSRRMRAVLDDLAAKQRQARVRFLPCA